MGQQQLLLIVFGIVIVGLAVLTGLQAFAVNQRKSNADALQITSMRMASDAQAWLRTPTTHGGGMPTLGSRPGSFTGLSLSLRELGYEVTGSGVHIDVNGTYTGAITGGDFIVTAISASTSGAGDNNIICTIVSGPMVDDVTTVINPPSGTC